MRNQVRMDADLSQVAEFVGSAEGWAGYTETPYYIDDLLRAAHNVTAKEFDKETAVMATATGNLSHMYEWGTVGINPAPGKMRLNPTSKAAKLWRHNLLGSSKSKTIGFTFRPSIVSVPLPTARTSGIKGSSVKAMPYRKHFFYARPWITELGTTVIIKPKYAKALFIPFYGNPSRYADQRSIKRGYVMTSHALKVTPGKTLAGNFTAHWYGWWNVSGREIMDTTAGAIVDGDSRAVIKTSGKSRALRTYRGGNKANTFSLQVSAAKAVAQALMKSRSNKRAVAELEENIDIMGLS